MNTNKPKVIFIGGKNAGKTSAIKAIWNQENNRIDISEFVEGRGEVNYEIIELPFIPFSVNAEMEEWLANVQVRSVLSKADVIVLIFEFGDIQYKKRIGIYNMIKNNCRLKHNVSFVIGLNKIEYYIEGKEEDGNFLVPLSFSSKLLNYILSCNKVINQYCKRDNIFAVIPFASFEIQWNIANLKDAILEGVIKRHNELVYKSSDPTIVFIGKTGCGKSSTINTICGTSLPVDGSAACTKYPIVINKNVNFFESNISVNIVDLPGIAESIDADIVYQDYYNRYIKNASVIVCLSQANTRAYTQDEIFFKNLYEKGILSRSSKVILAINKIDLLFKTKNNPDGIDLSTISDDDLLIKEKIDDYYDNVFANVFSFLPTIRRDSVIVYSNFQLWNINKLIHKIYQSIN